MKELINSYARSCELLRNRIAELTQEMNTLKRTRGDEEIKKLDLNRRISLLYTEYREGKTIILQLSAYERRVEQRVKTENLL